MFKFYLLSSVRHLMKFKFYSLINIIGLAISFSIAIIIGLFVFTEFSTDSHVPDANRVSRIVYNLGGLSVPDATAYEHSTPGVEAVTLIRGFSSGLYNTVISKDKKYQLDAIEVDSNFFKVFSYPLIYGDIDKVLSSESILLSKSKALEIFGNIDPVGKMLLVRHEMYEMTFGLFVRGVFNDLPANSSMQYNAVVYDEWLRADNDPMMTAYCHYLKLDEGVDRGLVEARVLKQLAEYRGDDINEVEIKGFAEYNDMYFNEISGYPHRKGNKQQTVVYLVISLLIVLIAGFNYFNLSLAISGKRSKEIGIRKILGCEGHVLFKQFMTEMIIVGVLAIGFALVIAEVALPAISARLHFNVDLDLYQYHGLYLIFTILVGFVIVLMAALFPIFLMLRVKSTEALNGKLFHDFSAVNIRRMMIVFQLSISSFLIICSIMILAQLSYLRSQPLGYSSKGVVFSYMNVMQAQFPEAFASEVRMSPHIKEVSYSNAIPGMVEMMISGEYNQQRYDIYSLPCDERYLDVMGIELLKGRNLQKSDRMDTVPHVILNEKACEIFGEDILGKTIKDTFHGDVKVVGICKNFFIQNPALGYSPVMMICERKSEQRNAMLVKFEENHEKAGIEYLEDKYESFSPGMLPEFIQADQLFEKEFDQDKELSQSFTFFTLFAILLACLGMFGMSVFSSEQRVREVGIRKVLGASSKRVLFMQLKEYFLLVVIANIIVIPLSYYLLNEWLSRFAFHVNLKWYYFFITFGISLFLSVIAVGVMAVKMSRLKPVEVLKYE